MRPTIEGIRRDAAADDVDAAMETFTTESDGLIAETVARTREVARRIQRENRAEIQRMVDRLGIRITDTSLVNEQVSAFVSANARLIRSVRGQLRDQVAQEVVRGIQSGERWEAIAASLVERVGVAESRAVLIARDQTSKFFGSLTQAHAKGAGIERYEWVTSNDERVRDEHAALNGMIFSWDNPPSEGNPGDAVNCRCIASPVLDDL